MTKPTNVSQKSTTNTSPQPLKSVSKSPTNPAYPLVTVNDGLTYPVLSMGVYISGPASDAWGFSAWLGRAGCYLVDTPLKADLVVFTGGSDVNPSMYGENVLSETHVDLERDKADNALYEICFNNRIPMIGICRGLQFLWVKMGGKLYQDINGHNDGEHEITYFETNTRYLASSVHHQSAFPTTVPGMRLLASSRVSTTRKCTTHVSQGPGIEYEIIAFMEQGMLLFQGHPEYKGWPEYSKLCADLIKKHIFDSTYTKYEDGNLRVVNLNK